MYKEKIASFFGSGEGTQGGLPTWAKGILAVGGAAVAFFVIKGILKRVKEQASTQQARQTVVEQTNEANQLAQSGMKPTFNGSQYKAWADAIQKQFDGCDFAPATLVFPPTAFWNSSWSFSGTKVAMIVNELKNDLDFLLLSKAYGIRTHDQCGFFTGDFTGNLQQAIADELDYSEIRELNKRLAKVGIKYKF